MTSGYSVPWARKRASENRRGLDLEDLDELAADDLAFGFRLVDPRQGREEPLRGVHPVEFEPELLEIPFHRVALALPQESGIDKNRHQPVADGLAQKHCGHRRIDPARDAADHPALRQPVREPGHQLVADHRRAPVAACAGQGDEVFEHPHPVGRVPDLGMELQPHEPPFRIEDRCHLGGRSPRQDPEPLGNAFHQIAVAHPHRLFAGGADKDRLLGHDLEFGESVLAVRRGTHVPAQVPRHQLEAVADAENGDTE